MKLVGLEPAVVALIEQSKVAVRVSPRSGPAWGKLGLALQANDFNAEAQFCFTQAEQFDPAEPRWPYHHGLLLAHDQADEAIVKLRRAATLCRDQSDAPRLRLAELLIQRGQLDEAERQYQELLRLNARHPIALLGLAKLNDIRGRSAESLGYLQRVSTNTFIAKSVQTLTATVQQKLGNAAAAAAVASAAASLPPDQPWPDPYSAEAALYQVSRVALLGRVQRLLSEGNVAEALPLLMRAVEDYPASPEAWLLLGRARLAGHDCVAAENALRQHLRLAADSTQGNFQLGNALLCQERYVEAAACFQQAVQFKPDFGEAHFNRGFALARAGKGIEAMQAFRDAIRSSPNYVDPYITLADLLDQSGQKEEAIVLLRRALELSPADDRAKFLLERVQKAR